MTNSYKEFKKEIIVSVLITVLALGAILFLFGYADRRAVFLYGQFDFTPFHKMTTGRYWMSGFVISGFIVVLYLIIQVSYKIILKAEIIKWYNILKYSSFPIISGVLIITMTTGEPKMPLAIAISIAFTLVTGLVLCFSIVDDLVNDINSTISYVISSMGLVPFLILFRTVEMPAKGILTVNTSIVIAGITFLGGWIWLLLSFRLFKKNPPGCLNIIKGTLAISYIGLPMLHYLTATPEGLPYITSSDNFFADNIIVRMINWIFLLFVVFLTNRIANRGTAPPSSTG
ncbi:MAG: hypothetical protein PHH93_05135 [Prolixibacteraceae bacterium]|nr:hypothetical protein [Prolixibacteraceae bacterium]